MNGCTYEKKKMLEVWRENKEKREKYLGTQSIMWAINCSNTNTNTQFLLQ